MADKEVEEAQAELDAARVVLEAEWAEARRKWEATKSRILPRLKSLRQTKWQRTYGERAKAVFDMRSAGGKYADIARTIGVTTSRAREIYVREERRRRLLAAEHGAA